MVIISLHAWQMFQAQCTSGLQTALWSWVFTEDKGARVTLQGSEPAAPGLQKALHCYLFSRCFHPLRSTFFFMPDSRVSQSWEQLWLRDPMVKSCCWSGDLNQWPDRRHNVLTHRARHNPPCPPSSVSCWWWNVYHSYFIYSVNSWPVVWDVELPPGAIPALPRHSVELYSGYPVELVSLCRSPLSALWWQRLSLPLIGVVVEGSHSFPQCKQWEAGSRDHLSHRCN